MLLHYPRPLLLGAGLEASSPRGRNLSGDGVVGVVSFFIVKLKGGEDSINSSIGPTSFFSL